MCSHGSERADRLPCVWLKVKYMRHVDGILPIRGCVCVRLSPERTEHEIIIFHYHTLVRATNWRVSHRATDEIIWTVFFIYLMGNFFEWKFCIVRARIRWRDESCFAMVPRDAMKIDAKFLTKRKTHREILCSAASIESQLARVKKGGGSFLCLNAPPNLQLTIWIWCVCLMWILITVLS